MCDGQHLIEQLRQERGAVYTELRGEIFGRERGRAETFKRYERAGRDVRVMGRKGVKELAVDRDRLSISCL